MTTSAVLFDLDGTLVNTRRLYFEAYKRALQSSLGRPITDHDIIAVNARTERRLFEASLPPALIDECVLRFYEHYAELHSTHFEGVYTGVPEVLAELRARGLMLGIVTGKSRRAWEVTAAAAGLGEFDVVVVEDDVAEAKPDPAGLRLAIGLLGLPAAQAVYVGDAQHDLDAARAAGMRGIAALWSKSGGRHERLKRVAEDMGAATADAPAPLLALI